MNEATLIDRIIAIEGGYSDHPADRGGPTRWGITQAVARKYGYTGDMRELPKSIAASIYRQLYWIGPRLDKISMLSESLATEMFDTAVNMGAGTAIRFLQRALNALNRGERDYSDIAIDQRIGLQTLAALERFLKKRSTKGEQILIRAIDSLQAERYIRLAEIRPDNEHFLFGWLANRVSA